MQSIRLSPDGRLISNLGTDPAGVQQLWVRQVDGGTVRKLTDVPSGVTSYEWAQNSRIVCYERHDGSGQKLVALELATGRERTVVAIDGAEFGNIITRPDVENVLRHPRTGRVQAVSYLADPRQWDAVDPLLSADFQRVGQLEPGTQIGFASRDAADERWLVWLSRDTASRRCYLWDRRTRKATLVYDDLRHLKNFQFAKVRPISLAARDGLRIHGYLTLPVGIPARRLPLVVWVHGGPTLRDAWGFDHIGQLFANRGYVFLRVNFRGSSGYGRRFRLAGRKQWGRAMQDDIVDAVDVIVRSGVADRSRMAIIGHSYGGYSALAALAMTPDLFACGAASSTRQQQGARRVPRAIWPVMRRKPDQLDAVTQLDDLRVPPGNRLHALSGKRVGYHAIRVNDQGELARSGSSLDHRRLRVSRVTCEVFFGLRI